MLEVKEVHAYYGRSHILHGVSLNVRKREIVCLLGRNGVGKTTTLKSIMGIVPAEKGVVLIGGRDVTHLKTHEIARCGVSYVPEDRRIFPTLTVKENLILGTKNVGHLSAMKKGNLEKMYQYFPRLEARKGQFGGTLSGGEQQMLTIARGLMGSPKLMLLDEPCEGLAPIIVQELTRIIPLLCASEGLTLLLVEQNAHVALKLSQRGYVLEKGMVTYHGKSSEMRESEEVKQRCGI